MVETIWRETILQDSQDVESQPVTTSTPLASSSFPAIFSLQHREKLVFTWGTPENGPYIRLRLRIRLYPAHISFLELTFNLHPTGEPDHAHALQARLMITGQHTDPAEVQVEQITVDPATATEAALPAWLTQTGIPLEQLMESGHIWRLRLPYVPDSIHASNLFGKADFGPLEGSMEAIRQYFRKPQQLELWTTGFNIAEVVHGLTAAWQQEAHDPPLLRWYPDQPRHQSIQVGQYVPPDQRPVTDILPGRDTFVNPLDYQTTLGFGAIYEIEMLQDSLEKLGESLVRLTLLTIPGAGDRRYFGLIELPEDSIARLMPGDVASVVFDREIDCRDDDWHARVVPQLPFARPGTVSVILTRPWNRLEKTFLQLPPNVPFCPVDIMTLRSPDEVRAALNASPTSEVRFHPEPSDKPFRRQIVALDYLRRKSPRATWDLLLSNNIRDLPTYDLYETIAEDLTDFPTRYRFNHQQAVAWHMMRSLTGRVGLVQGPPGTGKSFWLTRTFLPFVMYPPRHPATPTRRHQVLLTAASNQVVTDLAVQMDALVRSEVSHRPVLVIRIHALETEKTIAWVDATTASRRIRPDPAARPAIINPPPDDEDLSSLVAAMILMHFYEDQYRQRFPGVSDARVQEHRLSLGYRMLQFAGLAQPTLGDPSQYTVFVQFFDNTRRGVELTPEDKIASREATKALMMDVIHAADVLAMTLSMAGESWVHENAKFHAIGVDEAAKVTEPELWTLFAQHQPCPIVLVGDMRQLAPTVFSTMSASPFSRQLRVSLFSRLVMAGMPDTMLCEQHRMEPTISTLVSTVFYRGALQDAPSVRAHPTSQSIRQFNRERYQRDSTLLVLDVPHGMAHPTGATKSLVNHAHVTVVTNLILQLLDAAVVTSQDIAILTPYHAQYACYLSALYRLQEARPHGKLGDILVRKVDAFQGGERRVVVLDLTVSAGVGFLSEANRLNVALSRAQSGMYVVANVKGIEDAKKRRAGRFLNSIISFARHRRCIAKVQTPEACPYVAGSSHHQASVSEETTLVDRSAGQPTELQSTDQAGAPQSTDQAVSPPSADQTEQPVLPEFPSQIPSTNTGWEGDKPQEEGPANMEIDPLGW